MHKSNCMKKTIAIVLLIVTVSVPFLATAEIWGNVHNWCKAGDLELWLIYHPNEDWHHDYRHDCYDYKKVSATQHSYTDEESGVCNFCGARVTLFIYTKYEDHTFVNTGISDKKLVAWSSNTHTYAFYQNQKCSKNCGAISKYYTSKTSNHSWVLDYVDKQGKKHYKCSCGKTKTN